MSLLFSPIVEVSDVTCRNGHILQPKITSGGVLGAAHRFNVKRCHDCFGQIGVGSTRYSCKPCDEHCCSSCHETRRRSLQKPATPSCTPCLSPGCLAGTRASRMTTDSARKRRACKYGNDCYQKNDQHLRKFAHPGDRFYRNGLVIFEHGQEPEFHTLYQLYQFFDPDESGHLSLEEFVYVVQACQVLAGLVDLDVEQAWKSAGGELKGYVNFQDFTIWSESVGIKLPVGVEVGGVLGGMRPCRFRQGRSVEERCSCESFVAAGDKEGFCICGHKERMHRSDFAEGTNSQQMLAVPKSWQAWENGLVQVHDPVLIGQLQELLNQSHKPSDNWTRDRGCKKHGVNSPSCSFSCAMRNKNPVPRQFLVAAVFRNQNLELWQRYTIAKGAIAGSCSKQEKFVSLPTATSAYANLSDSPLDSACNEWLLFHGTDLEACRGICNSNFRLALAGTGATWKTAKKSKGVPLYGFGVYFSERITKADEYAHEIPESEVDMLRAITPLDSDEGVHAVLVCRVIGGCSNIITANEIDVDKLRTDVFEGPYDSVFGDRVTVLDKPYNEIVVYDKDQCFPEFLLYYQRSY